MNRFSVVEFEDGLHLVPTKWLKGSSECFWPTHKNIKRLHKNISECEEPDDETWETVKVVRIFGTANSYESGMAKVKLAEKFSDIESSDVDDAHKKKRRKTTTTSVSDESDNDSQHMLPPPPKKPFSKTSMNSKNDNVPMEDSPLENAAKKKHSNDNTSVQNVSKKSFTETNVSKDNNAILLADIDLKKELLRRCNKMDAKLDRIDGKLNSLEEKLENSLKNKKHDIDITEIVSFPLKTKEDLDKLELDLQEADFFKNMIIYMKHLGGKTYHEMTVIILKHTISNFLSTLYCWNGKDGKKTAFKDLIFAKCIKHDQQITQIIAKWFIQGKLRCDRDEERLQRNQKKSQD
ncbi:uncharacterized protein LOC113004659 isoform X3 [Solenopsis invicta]|uniref:uncharacterized protein LOC113004659 isoform X3 n=1 Tax=Solenopsis invicta TaxID=13686 RepID=UPI00193E4BDD|nr:uncharacterized protein LOC113004659 isoform X3 [Solenopsis invicta]